MKKFFINLTLIAKLNNIKRSAVFAFLVFVVFALDIFFKASLNKNFKLFNATIITPVLLVAMIYYWNKEKKHTNVRRINENNQISFFFFFLAVVCMFTYEFRGRLPIYIGTSSVYLFILSTVLGVITWLWANRGLSKQ